MVSKSAEQGHAKAQYRVGEMYDIGEVIEQMWRMLLLGYSVLQMQGEN